MTAPPENKVQSHLTETKNTTCYMCACRCGIRVTLRDGEIRYIEGNTEHPINKGVIFAKGASGIIKQYSPARLTKSVLRKVGSDRGAAEFDEIGWNKAFSILEKRLAEIGRTDPKKLALFTGRAAAKWKTPWLSRVVIVLSIAMLIVFIYGLLHSQAGWLASRGVATIGWLGIVVMVALYVCTGMTYA